MLDACAPHARWIDVFCEAGAFDVDQARAILDRRHRDRGLGARMHAGPAGRVRRECGSPSSSARHPSTTARSSRRPTSTRSRRGDTVATLLPGAEFSTRQPYPDARRLLDAGVTVALATDCNPGSSYTSSMRFCIARGRARDGDDSRGGAARRHVGRRCRARRDDIGETRGRQTSRPRVLAAPSYMHLAYRPGVPLVAKIIAGPVDPDNGSAARACGETGTNLLTDPVRTAAASACTGDTAPVTSLLPRAKAPGPT